MKKKQYFIFNTIPNDVASNLSSKVNFSNKFGPPPKAMTAIAVESVPWFEYSVNVMINILLDI